MRRLFVILIFILLFIAGFIGFGVALLNEITDFEIPLITFNNENTEQQEIDPNTLENQYSHDEEQGIKIIITKKIPQLIINDDKEKYVKDVLAESNFSLGINGGYFLPDWSHAGLLEIDGKVIVNEALNDDQVTGLVLIDDNKLSIEPIENIYKVDAETVFQTGPIIILNNEIQTTEINKAPNGTGEYLRSFIGTTSNDEIIIGVTTKFISLNELSETLLQNEKLKGKSINVINLDGGSSTFLYSKEYEDFQVNIFRNLPFILGF